MAMHGAAEARATKEAEKPRVGWLGPRWARRLGRFWWKWKKIEVGRKKGMGWKQGMIEWAAEKCFQIFKQRFEFKSQGFKYFQTRFELDSFKDRFK
jgi:hypothetical protein